MNKEEFIEEIKKLNVEIDNQKYDKLEKYYNLLIKWNKKINLTAITEKKEVYLKHFYDSLSLVKIINLKKEKTLCDIGTGAGFPGIILKIFFPNLKITLVDSLNKRIKFLDIVIKELDLKGIETIHTRIEEYALRNKEKFDIVTARAVAPLNILLEYSIPIVKVDKFFIAMKGKKEIISKKTLNLLDIILLEEKKFILPFENSDRLLIKFKKEKATNKTYPRRYVEIKKNPLP